MIFYHNIDPVLFSMGSIGIRWYGLMFAVGLLVTYLVIRWLFGKRGFKLEDLDSLVFLVVYGIGHWGETGACAFL